MASALSELSESLADLAAEVASRLIAVEGADGRCVSGFVWSDGLAVTADEALDGEDDVRVTSGDGAARPARIIGRDPSTDVVLLGLETPGGEAWPAATVPRPGSLALLAGRGEYGLLAGAVAIMETGPAWRSMRGGSIDARIVLGLDLSPHAEGSAVVAPDGRLIGMAVGGPRHGALAIPAATISRAVSTLRERGYVPRGWLGVSLHPLGAGGGAIVVGIEPGSPASSGGLLVGDIVTTWDGETVATVAAVADRLGGGTVGSTIRLGVARGGHAHELEIVIGERPRS